MQTWSFIHVAIADVGVFWWAWTGAELDCEALLKLQWMISRLRQQPAGLASQLLDSLFAPEPVSAGTTPAHQVNGLRCL